MYVYKTENGSYIKTRKEQKNAGVLVGAYDSEKKADIHIEKFIAKDKESAGENV